VDRLQKAHARLASKELSLSWRLRAGRKK
jgi:hypothetical protein